MEENARREREKNGRERKTQAARQEPKPEQKSIQITFIENYLVQKYI